MDPCRLDLSASIFALSNGYLGIRGALDDSQPVSGGTFISGFFDTQPIRHAETAYGYPKLNQVIASVPDPTAFELAVDGDGLDLRTGVVHRHERELDLRGGTLTRHLDWTSPADRRIQVTTRRLVSLARKGVAAIEYCVRPSSRAVDVTVTSRLAVPATSPGAGREDPRAGTEVPTLIPIAHEVSGDKAVLTFRTASRQAFMSAGVRHEVRSREPLSRMDTERFADEVRTTITCWLQPGEELRITKLLAYAHHEGPETSATGETVAQALSEDTSFDELAADQASLLREYWACVDVEVDGDPELQQAIRFGLFQLLQATACSEVSGVPAKGLTGTGYDGHTFWDSEGFLLPALTYLAPDAARQMLLWRVRGLADARQRAEVLALPGAAFPWRTIDGRECSGYWPASTAAFHLNAVISEGFTRYLQATGDESLEAEGGLRVLIETARLWAALGHYDDDRKFHLDGVTGPDEYSAIQNDNTFTNLMAARNLKAAADAVLRHRNTGHAEDVTEEELESWLTAADSMHIPFNRALGVHEQSSGFTQLREWDFEQRSRYPLMLHSHYVSLYSSQVIKQADLVLAMHWCHEAFDESVVARTFDYYERRTVRDSSLSAPTQAIVAASLGHTQLAYDYLSEAALVDLRDYHSNSFQGLHIASMAAVWSAVAEGFGGMRHDGGHLSFDPVLPPSLDGLRFTVNWQGMVLRVEIEADKVTYRRKDHNSAVLLLKEHGQLFALAPGARVERDAVRRKATSPPPKQPLHRAPVRRLPSELTADSGRRVAQAG